MEINKTLINSSGWKRKMQVNATKILNRNLQKTVINVQMNIIYVLKNSGKLRCVSPKWRLTGNTSFDIIYTAWIHDTYINS